MTQHIELVGRYQHLRQVAIQLNHRLLDTLPKKSLHEGGKKLGILKNNVLVFDSEKELSVLMEYCLHEVREQGITVIERYLRQSPPPADSEEMRVLQALRQARYSLFIVEEVEPGAGVLVRDLLDEELFFVMDIGFSQSARVGLILSSRIFCVDGINMATGGTLPFGMVPPNERAQFQEKFLPELRAMAKQRETPKQASEMSATLIRGCLQRGATSHIQFRDSGSAPSPTPLPPRATPRPIPQVVQKPTRIGRNDRCPCGSGKKFKHCCGTRR